MPFDPINGLKAALQPMPSHQPETTALSTDDEGRFRQWAQQNGIQDFDAPDAHYDMRGFWQSTQGAPHPPGSELHFPDTFKQHGHPTFSQESQYSGGDYDGGMWAGPQHDQFLSQPRMKR